MGLVLKHCIPAILLLTTLYIMMTELGKNLKGSEQQYSGKVHVFDTEDPGLIPGIPYIAPSTTRSQQ